MNLYFITRTNKVGWDQYRSFVCVATDENEALATHPEMEGCQYDTNQEFENANVEYWNEDCNWPTWITDKSKLKVEQIGTTTATKRRVILASFNAG